MTQICSAKKIEWAHHFPFESFIEMQLIYSVVLASGIQQGDSAVHACVYVCVYIHIRSASGFFHYELLQDSECGPLCRVYPLYIQ